MTYQYLYLLVSHIINIMRESTEPSEGFSDARRRALAAQCETKVGPPRRMGYNVFTRLDRNEIAALREAGFSWAQIAEYYDLSIESVRVVMRDPNRRYW